MRDFGEAPPPPTFFERLKAGLSRSTGGLTDSIGKVIAHRKLDAISIGELEEALIKADLGPALAARLAQAVSDKGFGADVSDYDIRETLRAELLKVLDAGEIDALVTDAPANGGPLTPRELEVLAAMADGASNKVIARRLGISFHTAKFHVAAILAKLDADSRTEAVARAAHLGLVML